MMMATKPLPPNLPAPRRPKPFMRSSASGRSRTGGVSIDSIPQPASASRRSVDFAGRKVRLSRDIPAVFDHPLGPHHKMIGRWAASRDATQGGYSRVEACRLIERTFRIATLDVLASVVLADLRVVVLRGEVDRPPAICIICESAGQLDLGWIETSDAPIGWRAAAYAALERMLGRVLPVFAYQDLFEEISLWYWEGETDDAAALDHMVACHGVDRDDLDGLSLPSAMNDRRPAWMIRERATRTGRLPPKLRDMVKTLGRLHGEIGRVDPQDNAWHLEYEVACDYLPRIEERSFLPPMTLVPIEHFAREIDDIAQHGMEVGFMDLAGLCPLSDDSKIDRWMSSLRLGVELLTTAQALIQLDPNALRGPYVPS